jgi:hypothetical protein
VTVAEALPATGLDPVQAEAGLLSRERLAGKARLLALLEAELGRRVLDLAQVQVASPRGQVPVGTGSLALGSA